MAKYPRGCNLALVPKATEVPPLDLKTILSVDTSNPFLRMLRIQQGYLTVTSLPVELRTVVASLPTIVEEKK